MLAEQKLEEILSWRLMTEIWRRNPKRFDLIEAHPGGGQYDCLVLLTKEENPRFAIDVHRGGSVHIHRAAFGLDGDTTLLPDWMERMMGASPRGILDDIANEARLGIPKRLPASTPATLSYRYISDFLTHSIGRLDDWECRNGFEDTSGYGGGVRKHYFKQFPLLTKETTLRHGTPILGEYAYNFWFLLKNGDPVMCLDTSGNLFRRDGTSYDLTSLYQRDRCIWPLIFKTAIDLLP